MESGDSCSRLQMIFLFHLGQCHGFILGKRFWRTLDAYSGDHGKVDKGNLFILDYSSSFPPLDGRFFSFRSNGFM